MILSIVILSYNTRDLVIENVSSLQKLYERELKEKDIEIIVVDNASEKKVIDDIEKELKEKDGITLIKSGENLGFGKGSNLGAENAKGEFILFLNSDTRTNDKGFLEMAEFLQKNPKVGVLGGRLLNDDGTPQKSAGKFYNLFNVLLMLFGGERMGLLRSSPKVTKKIDWVSGACMMVNKNIFDKVGGFDINIFMYVEDMEFCYRLGKMGYDTYFYSNVSVSHKEQGSSNRTFAVVNIYEGIAYFYKKHKSAIEYQVVKFFLFLKALTVYILGKLTNNSYYTKTYGEVLRRVL